MARLRIDLDSNALGFLGSPPDGMTIQLFNEGQEIYVRINLPGGDSIEEIVTATDIQGNSNSSNRATRNK